jgi:hypothetical protein
MVPNVKGAEHDESLADAEHYSYARYLASVTGDPAAHALVSGYELKKRLSPGSVQRANKNYPVLAPSKESEAWGHRGVDDGLDEYKAAHGGKLGKFGSSAEAQHF